MAFPPKDPGDLGIVYYKIGGTPTGNYTSIQDETIAIEELTGSYTAMSSLASRTAIFDPSGRSALTIFVYYTKSGSSSIDVKIQGRYGRTTAPFTTDFDDITSTKERTGIPAQAHNLAATGLYIIQTASALTLPDVQVVVKANGGPLVNGDVVVIAARVN